MAAVTIQSPLVSVDWLNKNRHADNLVILDASIPKVTSTSTDTTPKVKIPNSRFFDIKKAFSDTNAEFPNTLPSANQFQNAARQIGINTNSAIVVYDNMGIYSSPRAWWLLKAFGHFNVAVLDGGLPEWMAAGLEVEEGIPNMTYDSGNFEAHYNQRFFTDFEGVKDQINNTNSLIIDSRSSARFNSQAPEPRKGVRSGHIEGSVSLPYSELLATHKLKEIDEIKRIFNTLVDTEDTLVMSCGTGITACVSALAANICGYDDIVVYDGSWTEYGTLTN